MALGQVAAYGFLVLGPTYYVRRHLGRRGWKRVHRFIATFSGLGVIHGLTAGTDATTSWFRASVLPVVGAAALLVVSRSAAGPASAQPRS